MAGAYADKNNTGTGKIAGELYITLLLLWLYALLLGPGRFFNFLILHTVDRNPWDGDQPAARPLPTQDNTNRINTQTSMPRVGFEPHDVSV
jgi:uncharacterized membrane protein